MHPVLAAATAALAVLLIGDFASTFFYHVPQHVWGKLHLRTHHDGRRSYWDHAVLSRDPGILLDGLLGAVPYMFVALVLCRVSVAGALIGLAIGQVDVWWRHTCEIGWVSPPWLVRIARVVGLVLPEDHNGHHKNPEVEFGDLFRFYDVPAQRTIAFLRGGTRALAAKSRRVRAVRIARIRQNAAKLRVVLRRRSSPVV